MQVVGPVLSVDQENDPAILAINGASAALTISDIPFQGPIGAVRMGYLDGQVVVNPRISDMERSELDLVVAGTADAILMVEAGARGVSEQVIVDALELAHENIRRICQAFEDLRAEVGKAKVAFVAPEYDPEVKEAVEDFLSRRLDDVAYHPDKAERDEKISSLKREMKDALAERWRKGTQGSKERAMAAPKGSNANRYDEHGAGEIGAGGDEAALPLAPRS